MPTPFHSVAFRTSVSRLETKMVPFDDVVRCVMSAWQDYNDVRMVQDAVALEVVFNEADANGNSSLDFHEFKALITRRDPSVEVETIMGMFDHGLQLTSEQKGEESDSISFDSFMVVAVEHNLISLAKSAYASPVELARRGGRLAESLSALVIPKGVGVECEDEDEVVKRAPDQVRTSGSSISSFTCMVLLHTNPTEDMQASSSPHVSHPPLPSPLVELIEYDALSPSSLQELTKLFHRSLCPSTFLCTTADHTFASRHLST